MDLNLRGRTAFITGASAGIGAGVARVLAREGVRVAIAARRADALEALAVQIADAGAEKPVVVTGDVTDALAVSRMVNEVFAALGPIDILVNSAGGARPTRLDAPDED